ncbi:hypothetical protein BKG86_17315 [Mycobacteroides chelonae]|uniref:hypothetical protein n=1 Tax=Mycobacteroides chelonae TaxID=1774 RepID=UPI0008AA5519|nr:hypothetical protein [Mycobacteroides chelonae]OHU71411.1 hypothetical protein BKG86_17315 [Mycobacteroides chelonae]
MFDEWVDPPDITTLVRVERPVIVDMSRAYPRLNIPNAPPSLGVRAYGLKFMPSMHGQQVAWFRRADGGWMAVVLVPIESSNGRSVLTMQLWVTPDAITLAQG